MSSTVAPHATNRTDATTRLDWAAVLFTVAVLLHNGDHLRRGSGSVETDVVWAGSLAILLEVGVVAAVFMRHHAAPLLAAASGAGLAVGYVVVHLLPGRGWLSDPLFDGGASWSQSAALLEIVAAVALAWAGWSALQARGGLASATTGPLTERPMTDGLLHPVVLAMAIGNAIIFVLTLARY
jgi:hypothetical protein